jgi:uncharacterized protein YyaL (SSP411 family)
MIRGMGRPARVFGRNDWLDSARSAVSVISDHMYDGPKLLASYKDGRTHPNACLDDYAFMIQALIELLQAVFRIAELELAKSLSNALMEQFEDAGGGGFYFVGRDHESLASP